MHVSPCLEAIAEHGSEPLPMECFAEWGMPEPAPLPEGYIRFGAGTPSGPHAELSPGDSLTYPLETLGLTLPPESELTPLPQRTPITTPCSHLIASIRWSIVPEGAAVDVPIVIDGGEESAPQELGRTAAGDTVASACAVVTVLNDSAETVTVELVLMAGIAGTG